MARKNPSETVPQPAPLHASEIAEPPRPRVAAQPAIETIRIECLKLAVELRTATIPNRTVIANAKDFEAYVLGTDEDPDAKDFEAYVLGTDEDPDAA